jgi:Thioredoxin
MNEMDNAISKFFKDNQPNKIYIYEEYINLSKDKINNTKVEELEGQEKIYFEYRKMNLHRTNRIQKTFKPDEELVDKIKNISKPQTWLVITEDWCGDSAQNLPYILSYIESNPLIELLIILRDNNLETIDNYFVEGNPRSIPKIVGFDESGNELFIWGPRPKFAQDLVQQLKAEGYTKDEFNKELHLWYGRNKGKELEKELVAIFNKM